MSQEKRKKVFDSILSDKNEEVVKYMMENGYSPRKAKKMQTEWKEDCEKLDTKVSLLQFLKEKD